MASVLVIDDEAVAREFMREALLTAGHAVREARDGNDGLRQFGREPADLVVCDLFMPERDGLETIRELRRIAPAVRILGVTGGGHVVPAHQMLATARALGAAAVLRKPFTVAEFLEAVAGLLT